MLVSSKLVFHMGIKSIDFHSVLHSTRGKSWCHYPSPVRDCFNCFSHCYVRKSFPLNHVLVAIVSQFLCLLLLCHCSFSFAPIRLRYPYRSSSSWCRALPILQTSVLLIVSSLMSQVCLLNRKALSCLPIERESLARGSPSLEHVPRNLS